MALLRLRRRKFYVFQLLCLAYLPENVFIIIIIIIHDINLLDENRKPETLSDAGTETVLEVNAKLSTWPYLVTLTRVHVKVSLSLCLTKHHTIKTYRGVEVQLHAFLTSALDAGEWWSSGTGRFTPGKGAHGSHWIGPWVGSGTGLDAVTKRKYPCVCRESNHGRPAHSLVPILTELSKLLPEYRTRS
jgi:hypothetical protein